MTFPAFAACAVAIAAVTVAGKLLDVPLAVAILLVAAYPVALIVLGFFEAAERLRLRGVLSRT